MIIYVYYVFTYINMYYIYLQVFNYILFIINGTSNFKNVYKIFYYFVIYFPSSLPQICMHFLSRVNLSSKIAL